MSWQWKTGPDGKKVRLWVSEAAPSDPTSFVVGFHRQLGYQVPEFVSSYTPVVEMIAEGARLKQPPRVHHTPTTNGRTGQPHTQDRAAQRRLRQMERAKR